MSCKKIKRRTAGKTSRPKGDRSMSPRKIMEEMAIKRRRRKATDALLEKMKAAGAVSDDDVTAAEVVSRMSSETGEPTEVVPESSAYPEMECNTHVEPIEAISGPYAETTKTASDNGAAAAVVREVLEKKTNG